MKKIINLFKALFGAKSTEAPITKSIIGDYCSPVVPTIAQGEVTPKPKKTGKKKYYYKHKK